MDGYCFKSKKGYDIIKVAVFFYLLIQKLFGLEEREKRKDV